MELKSIKSELNLSDHTQIIKYEPNVKHGACKVEGMCYLAFYLVQTKDMLMIRLMENGYRRLCHGGVLI